MLVDMLEPMLGFDGRGFIELRNRIWPMVVKQAVADGLPGLIATLVFERSVPETMVSEVKDHVTDNGGIVHFVHLLCERAENERRLASPGRTHFGKLTSAETFNRILASGHFTTPSGLGDALTLDTTKLSPGQAADRIASHWS